MRPAPGADQGDLELLREAFVAGLPVRLDRGVEVRSFRVQQVALDEQDPGSPGHRGAGLGRDVGEQSVAHDGDGPLDGHREGVGVGGVPVLLVGLLGRRPAGPQAGGNAGGDQFVEHRCHPAVAPALLPW